MTDLPIVITSAGVQPRSPAVLRALLIANVLATNPGYTANLPSSLIEDISSTDVAAIALCDSSYIDLINSLTPYAANDFLLIQQGQMVGVQQQAATNTSVNVEFTGDPGYVVAKGLVVSDGTYQYIIQDGGIIGAGGQSLPLFALATVGGTWSVPAGTVTQIVSSLPSGVTLTVTNPLPGVPASEAQTAAAYRASVLQAWRAASQGMASYLKTLLGNVPGVQPRLVSVRQNTSPAGWEIIVGGGDPYQVAYAIYYSLFDISTLVGSELLVSGITKANPGVITTVLTHNLVTGQTGVNIAGVTPTNYNGTYTVIVINSHTFSIGVNTSSFPDYVSGGIVTPNSRNQPTTIKDYPDIYIIPIVRPPQQTVTMTVTWNTTATNFVSTAAVSQAAVPAIVDYINSIYAGQPINLFELQSVFQAAVASILPPQLLTRMVFSVAIDGTGVSPESGTGIIAGDPESFLFATAAGITVVQG